MCNTIQVLLRDTNTDVSYWSGVCELFFLCFCVSAVWRLDFLCRLDPVFTTDMATLHRLQPPCDPEVFLCHSESITSFPGSLLYNCSHLSQQWPRSPAPMLCCVTQPSPIVCVSAQEQLHWWMSPINTDAWQAVYLIIPVQTSCMCSSLPGCWPWSWNQLRPPHGSTQSRTTQHNNTTGDTLISLSACQRLSHLIRVCSSPSLFSFSLWLTIN